MKNKIIKVTANKTWSCIQLSLLCFQKQKNKMKGKEYSSLLDEDWIEFRALCMLGKCSYYWAIFPAQNHQQKFFLCVCVGLGFELRCSTAWATTSVQFAVVILEMESFKIFAQADLELQPSQSQPPIIARIAGISHLHPAQNH
jgi:hypothetical protein